MSVQYVSDSKRPTFSDWGGLFLNINNDVLLTKTIHFLNKGIDCIYIVLRTKLHISDYSVW